MLSLLGLFYSVTAVPFISFFVPHAIELLEKVLQLSCMLKPINEKSPVTYLVVIRWSWQAFVD